jgi:hypothetical protein
MSMTKDVPLELIREADAFRDTLITKADAHNGPYPLWHGWAILDAYIAGVMAERNRGKRSNTVGRKTA